MARSEVEFKNGDIVELNGVWYTIYNGDMLLKDNHKRPLSEQAKLIWRSTKDKKK